MEFDWNNPPFELDSSLTQREIEESFEDPFAIRLMPDSRRLTNGKSVRVVHARPFQPEERFFYQRKTDQTLSQ
jgi:hypothetical protein